MKKLLCGLSFSLLASSAPATLISFDLKGVAGFGLLAGNEPQPLPTPTTASGGEIGAGITYDDVANVLNLTNVGWGSSNGFNNLSSLANNSHIHGPTASANGNGFTQTAGVSFTLNRSSNAVTGGVFTNPLVTLTATQETQLLNGQFYINLHTASNGGGELRGFLVPVPEPTAPLLGLLALGAALLRRRRA